MTGVSHQISGDGPATQPGGNHWNNVADHEDQIKALPCEQQPQKPAQEVEDLPLNEFGQTTPQACVAQPAGAEFMAAPQKRDAGLLIRAAETSQGQGRHRVATTDQCLAEERTGEVFPMAIAEQQDSSHSPHPGGRVRDAVRLSSELQPPAFLRQPFTLELLGSLSCRVAGAGLRGQAGDGPGGAHRRERLTASART